MCAVFDSVGRDSKTMMVARAGVHKSKINNTMLLTCGDNAHQKM